MAFYRNAYKDLEQWKQSPFRKPLVVRGARQTGKTTLIQEFGKEFDTFISLNLEKPVDRKLFEAGLPISQLIQRICLEKQIVRKGNTLLFIDEIQNSPEAVALMRYFYEESPELYVISAGSLLEIMMDMKTISFPVGRVEYLYLYPMTFKEFLLALGENQSVELLEEVPYPQWAHNHLTSSFRVYAATGGMPEVVARYVEEKDLSRCLPVYNSLLIAFQDDVSKYAKGPSEMNIMRRIIEVAPFEAGKRIRFNKFGNTEYKSREVGSALRTLERAMLLYLCYPTTDTELPLQPDFSLSPKLQFIDTGLLCHAVGAQAALVGNENIDSVFEGMISEHIVGQEILAQDRNTLHKPLFWVRNNPQSNAELDYLQIMGTHIVPIEVKSGKTGTLRSLHSFIDRTDIRYAVRLHDGDFSVDSVATPIQGTEYRLLNLPLFLASEILRYTEKFLLD